VTVPLLSRRDVEFVLFDWLRVDELAALPRFSDHSRDTLAASLDVYESVARDQFAPHNKKNDRQEPILDDGQVRVNPEVKEAVRAFSDLGLMAATLDYELGGMQLPYVVERAGMAYVFAANIASAAYPFLTMANANLLLAFGSAEQRRDFVAPMLRGQFLGTMCLSETQAGSSLADIRTRAVPDESGGYRLFGAKMWISGGDHDLSENIIHLVLAKIANADGTLPPGVAGISLFVVPKYLLGAGGAAGERNDVVVAGLNHKMGYRGTSNCVLNFGEGRHRPAGRAGAVGILLGDAGQGLAYMFRMMNEARIGVGVGAAALACSGYLQSVAYARERRQGRPLGQRNPRSPSVPIITHPDVRRMLLTQKAYAEGALGLALYAASLVDDRDTAPDADQRREAALLLDLLTPIVKSWPSQWGLAANDLAIQVHGGYGYTRDYNVEQLYRDNRLNPIHEGASGIQALDLLGRKVALEGGAAFDALARQITATVRDADSYADLRAHAAAIHDVWQRLETVTQRLSAESDTALRLANANAYMDAFGHIVVGWLWLSQAITAHRLMTHGREAEEQAFLRGKLQACHYFYRWELPKLAAWFAVLDPPDRTCLDMRDAWF
jgi:butyryl-CoA dehydrogenase/acyl-CoA dehydrogenase